MTIDELIADIDRRLQAFRVDYAGLGLREKVLCLGGVLTQTRKLNVAVARDSGCDARGASERIRLYFVRHVGLVLDKVEIEVVAGISEYGRRVRELRVQDGYAILTGASNDPEDGLELKPTQYCLLRAEPDHRAARRWHIANRIRMRKEGAGKQILAFLQESV